MVNLTFHLLFLLDTDRLPLIVQNLDLEYDEKVLPSIGNADQLLTEWPCISTLVHESLIRRAKDFNIVLDDVAITHLSYGSEFSEAVEQNWFPSLCCKKFLRRFTEWNEGMGSGGV